MSFRYFCCDERRRGVIDGHASLNGIDFIEVLDDASMLPEDRQRTLFVHFINDPSALLIDRRNILITGGERKEYINPEVTNAQIKIDSRSGSVVPVLVVEVKNSGDYSLYKLHLVVENSAPGVLDQVDPVLRSVDFSFKANCDSGFDCLAERLCPPDYKQSPAIDYLVKDYASFRQLMLDRMALLTPAWNEDNVADLGITLVELLAYVADYISYRQDAIATEAYLETARKRTSIRRHARLVDYKMHNGSNARCWMHIEVNAATSLAKRTQFLTSKPGLNGIRITPDSKAYHDAIASGLDVFETITSASLFPELSRIQFYTWGNRNCCLPKGAIKATLRNRLANLQVGMVLIFIEQKSPQTGKPADANIMHRHAVRLTKVLLNDVKTGMPLIDPIGGKFDDPPSNTAIEVTEIEWAVEDALPFAVCISSETDEQFKNAYVEDVSTVYGNIVLVDHGKTIKDEYIGQVPPSHMLRVENDKQSNSQRNFVKTHCDRDDLILVPPRFKPSLSFFPLTHAMPYDSQKPPYSAYATMHWRAADTLPDIRLNNAEWLPQYDLINSGTNKEFVVEVESDRSCYLRFGDGRNGARVESGDEFHATYRIGNGVQGNVGAESIRHIVISNDAIVSVDNPLAARGGVDLESIKHVRENATEAFRDLKRAVTPRDYETLTTQRVDVQKSVASLRWTGSWHTMFVSVDRVGGQNVDAESETRIRDYLEKYRLAGHDLEIDNPESVPLEVGLIIHVNCDYERSRVRDALLRVFSDDDLADGTRGMLHPDNFTFGQAVNLSSFYSTAHEIEGVDSVEVTLFQRQDDPGDDGIAQGFLRMGRYEIPRLRNDKNYPGQGVLELDMRGGR